MKPTDPLYAKQWHLKLLGNIEKLWDDYSGDGVTVGIWDTGVEYTHPDLDGNYDTNLHIDIGGGAIDGAPVAATSITPTLLGHGTSSAGLIAAENNGVDTVGIAWGSTIAGVNIFDSANGIDTASGGIHNAVIKMATFDIVNNSWNNAAEFSAGNNWTGTNSFDAWYLFGNPNLSSTTDGLEGVVKTGRGGLGTIVVQSAGNDDNDAAGVARNSSRFTVTVAATDEKGFAASYSNYGASILVTAPAGDFKEQRGPRTVTTDMTGVPGFNLTKTPTVASNYTDDYFGTSAAAPIVSGVIALMLDANSSLGWRDVQNILAASARHTGSDFGRTTPGHGDENNVWKINGATNWNGGGMHFSEDYGYGMVNAYNAVRMAEVWSLFETAQKSDNEKFVSSGSLTYPSPALTDNGTKTFTIPQDFMDGAANDRNIEIEHVDLFLNFTHANFTQLRITLISPSGSKYTLYDGRSGSDSTADTGINWQFGIDSLRGEHSLGDWKVEIRDAVGGETGTLNSLFIAALGKDATQDDVYHYTDEFLRMKGEAGQTGRALLTDTGGVDWINAAAVTGTFILNLTENVFSKVNGANWFKIAVGSVIERAITGDGNDTLTGNGADNRLYGMRGNDILNGGLGLDMLFGGAGNDTLDGGDGVDALDGGAGDDRYNIGIDADTIADLSGTDTITSLISRTLMDFLPVENLTLLGTAASGTGNGGANIITGNNAQNTLDGLGGNDTLIGGMSKDTMTGGLDNDTFRFLKATDSKPGANSDIVTDFKDFGFDKLDFSRLFGPKLMYIGKAAFSALGQLHVKVSGADLLVEANTAGSLAADFSVRLTDTTFAMINKNTDFVL